MVFTNKRPNNRRFQPIPSFLSESRNKGQALVIGIVAIVLVAVAIIALSGGDEPNSSEENQNPEDQTGEQGNVEGGNDSQGSSSSGSGETKTIEMSASGFTPQDLTVDQGDTVVFENVGEVGIEPAVDLHPTHTQYDGTSRSEHCENEKSNSEVFDSCSPVEPGESYNFTFEKTGEWNYHDHTHNPGNKGTIIVE